MAEREQAAAAPTIAKTEKLTKAEADALAAKLDAIMCQTCRDCSEIAGKRIMCQDCTPDAYDVIYDALTKAKDIAAA